MRMLQSILLATDLHPASRDVVGVAGRLARRFGSRITLLHALEPPPGWTGELHEQFLREVRPLQELIESLSADEVVVAESAVVVGPAVGSILDKAREIDADLILLGAGQPLAPGRFHLGPVAQAVLERAPQPVLTVRAGEPTTTFEKILCPVDGSPASRRGLLNAARLARAFAGELTALTVVPSVSWLAAAVESGHVADVRAEYARKWQEEFDRLVEEADLGPTRCRREVRHGVPHEEIASAVRDSRADLLVLGATGRTRLVRALVGGVTRRILRDLPCSLLTVKEEDAVAAWFEEDFRTVNVLVAQGQGLLAARSYAAAVDRFRLALTHHPFHVPALDGLALALEKLGCAHEAAVHRHRAALIRKEGWA